MLHLHNIDGYFAFDEAECRSLGQSLANAYQSADPFPHIVIDDFLSPDILKSVLQHFPASDGNDFFDREQERLKFQFRPWEVPSGIVRNVFAELNGQAFLAFLEELTGMNGLIPDTRFDGGGLHETKRGGHLGVHADFNVNQRMKTERKLNLLIYLNEDWEEQYGGYLELWDRHMNKCVVKVKPEMARAVIFNTALDSFHGHPDPLSCPKERSRRSLATYYYSAPEEGLASLPKRTTNFKARPGTPDKSDWQIKRHHFVNDWIPPRLQQFAHRLFG